MSLSQYHLTHQLPAALLSLSITESQLLTERERQLYSHAQGRHSVSESPSGSMRNSSHSCHRYVREGTLNHSDSSDSGREDSDSDEETGLRPPRESSLLHPALCWISLTVSSGRRMKWITTRVNYHLPPGLSLTAQ